MLIKQFLMPQLLLASAVALAIPVTVLAASPDGECCEHEMHAGPDMHGMKCEYREHHRRGGWDGSDGEHLPPMLHRLDLSDTQREQVRELMRGQSETMRAKAEALRNTHEELRKLPMSDDYSEAKVKELAGASGRSAAEMAELRAHTAHQIYQLLTPEQRKQLEERRKAREDGKRPDCNCDDLER